MNKSSDIVFAVHGLSVDAISLVERKTLIQDFDLEIRRGEIVGLVGETGAGKSLSMMASVGLLASGLEVVSGTVTFVHQQRDARDQKALRSNLARGVSLLFQSAKGALNPYMRARSQIERILRLNHIPPSQRPGLVRETLTSVGLDADEIGPKYPHEISGGQAQRVALACALGTHPQLLIGDEPTTALDVTTEREVLRLLRDLCHGRNMGLILIAHNLALVVENCERICILHAGQVAETGLVSEIFSDPLHPYTKGLIMAIPDVDEPKPLVPLVGSVWGGPSSANRCRFSHRCAHVMARCEQSVPKLIGSGDHAVRCFLYQ